MSLEDIALLGSKGMCLDKVTKIELPRLSANDVAKLAIQCIKENGKSTSSQIAAYCDKLGVLNTSTPNVYVSNVLCSRRHIFIGGGSAGWTFTDVYKKSVNLR